MLEQKPTHDVASQHSHPTIWRMKYVNSLVVDNGEALCGCVCPGNSGKENHIEQLLELTDPPLTNHTDGAAMTCSIAAVDKRVKTRFPHISRPDTDQRIRSRPTGTLSTSQSSVISNQCSDPNSVESRNRFTASHPVPAIHDILPPETLAEIFAFCAPKALAFPPVLSQSSWVLGKVCSSWRQVALQSHPLWNNILFNLEGSREPSRRLDSLASFLSSHTTPSISLHLQCHPCQPTSITLATDLTSLVIVPFSTRFRQLTLELPAISLSTILNPAAPVQFSSLENLILACSDDDDDSPHPLHVTMINDAPRLRHLTIETPSRQLNLANCSFPWSQLTELYLIDTTLSSSDLDNLLHQSTSLLHCSFVSPQDVAFDETRSLIAIPHLRSLKLNVDCNYNFGSFVRSLLLPSLETLELSALSTLPWPHEAVTEMVSQSIPPLSRLEIACAIPGREIERLLHSIPCLKELDVSSGEPLLPSTLTLLASGVLAPRLGVLKCRVTSISPFLDMITDRCSKQQQNDYQLRLPIVQFSSLTAYTNQPLSPACLERISVIRQAGPQILFEELE